MLVELCIKYNRYICQDCMNVFSPEFESVDFRGKMTRRLKEKLANESVEKTFSSVSRDYAVRKTSVKHAFGKMAKDFDREWEIATPKVLGIDECHFSKKMRSVFVDIDCSKIIEIREDRKKATIEQVLNSFKDPQKIELVTMDMCIAYREAVLHCLPKAKIVIDKFHVLQTVLEATSDAFNEVRNSMYAYFNTLAEKDEMLKRYKKLEIRVPLFRKNKEDLTASEIDRLAALVKIYPDYAKILYYKETFRDIFNKTTNEAIAKKKYADWKNSICGEDKRFKGFYDTSKTIDRWHEWIFNYFTYQCTNAVTETLNGIMKKMNSLGRGYSYEVLRFKMLRQSNLTTKPKYIRPSESSNDAENVFSYMSFSGMMPELIEGDGIPLDSLNCYLDELLATENGESNSRMLR